MLNFLLFRDDQEAMTKSEHVLQKRT